MVNDNNQESPADKIVCILYKYNTLRYRTTKITDEILRALAEEDPDELIEYIKKFKGEDQQNKDDIKRERDNKQQRTKM